jgi:hypothetical protein
MFRFWQCASPISHVLFLLFDLLILQEALEKARQSYIEEISEIKREKEKAVMSAESAFQVSLSVILTTCSTH